MHRQGVQPKVSNQVFEKERMNKPKATECNGKNQQLHRNTVGGINIWLTFVDS